MLQQAQKAIEECLDGTDYNPISVIIAETFDIVEDLTDAEIVKLLTERPSIMRNALELQYPPSIAVLFGDIARAAVTMEIQKEIDMTKMADAIAEWQGSARIPDHLSANVKRALGGLQAVRP